MRASAAPRRGRRAPERGPPRSPPPRGAPPPPGGGAPPGAGEPPSSRWTTCSSSSRAASNESCSTGVGSAIRSDLLDARTGAAAREPQVDLLARGERRGVAHGRAAVADDDRVAALERGLRCDRAQARDELLV